MIKDTRQTTASDKAKPTILLTLDERAVVDAAVAALAKHTEVFQRGGLLVHVVRGGRPARNIDRPPDAPTITPIQPPRLHELLCDAANWKLPGREGHCRPPKRIAAEVEARGQWPGVRRIEGIVSAPIVRADGSVLQTPGYDDQTGLLYEPFAVFEGVPNRPTLEDAQQAVAELLEVVEDFPFSSEGHRAAWVASAITPASRYAYHGPAPLTMVDANAPGVGKTLAVDAIAYIATGHKIARTPAPPTDAEFRKTITAIALGGDRMILLDNIVGALGCASLDAALTATTWTDRVLGVSQMARDIPLDITWYASANNIALRGDTSRRVLPIRLESRMEQPEDRTGFRHADLMGWLEEQSPRLAVAPATVLAAYCAAGRPDMGIKPWGSFERWSALVRQAVVWAGLPDPAGMRRELVAQADMELNAARVLLARLYDYDPNGTGVTTAELMELAKQNQDWMSILSEFAPLKNGKPLSPQSIGVRLRSIRQRVIGGLCVDSVPGHGGVAKWAVRSVEDGGHGGHGWDNLSPGSFASEIHRDENIPTKPTIPTKPEMDQEEQEAYEEFMSR
jgi:hypothetical protein